MLRTCGLSHSRPSMTDDSFAAAAAFAVMHDVNGASVAVAMRARMQAVMVVFHEIIARIVKRDSRRRCRQVPGWSLGFGV